MESSNRRGAITDLIFNNNEGLGEDVKVEDNLGLQ